MNNKWTIVVLITVLLVSLLSACTSSSGGSEGESTSKPGDTPSQGQASNGDDKVLFVAYDTKPPSIDPHMSTSQAAAELARPIFESLVAYDANFTPQPVLAESYEVSEDGKTMTFKLRQGIKFHNGKEMTSEDVLASMNRWKGLSVVAKEYFEDSTFEAPDASTFVIKMPERNSLAIYTLSSTLQFAAVMPKEIIEQAGAQGVSEYIGTGPYKVKEWVPDQKLELVKFEEYQALSTPRSGLAGKKEALVGTILFEIVSDMSTRLSGLQTGKYDIATNMSLDNYRILKNDPNISTDIPTAPVFPLLVFNKQEGPFTDVKMRQAVQAVLDMEQLLYSAAGGPEFFNLEPGLATEDQRDWHNDAGKELYNQKNIEKAKQLLQESGYNGEEILLLTTRTIEDFYNFAANVHAQLSEIGMNVKLDVYDWGTLLQRLQDPTTWHMYSTAFSQEPVPVNYMFLKSTFAGWNRSEKLTDLTEQIKASDSKEEMKALFTQIQQEYYDYVPSIHAGVTQGYFTTRKNIKGLEGLPAVGFWGISKED